MRKKLTSIPLPKSGRVVTPHTRMEMTLYPQDDDLDSQRDTSAHVFGFDPKKSEAGIVHFNWSKRLGSSSGTWSALLKTREDIKTLNIMSGGILGGDWMDGTFYRQGLPIPMFRGLVDTVRRQRRNAGGATITNYMISGRDHGAVFESPLSWSNLWVQTLNEIANGLFTERLNGVFGGSPDLLFNALINGMLSSKSPSSASWILPLAMVSEANTFLEALKISTGVTRGWAGNELRLWTSPGGTLHQALMEWCNPLLNEIIYDLGQKPSPEMWATLRERPFPNSVEGSASAWFGLTEWEIPTWLVNHSDVGISNHERFNVFSLIADIGGENVGDQHGLTPPDWNITSFHRHGVKPYLETTRFVNEASSGIGGWDIDRKKWLDLLKDWYGHNQYLLSGQIGIDCALPEVRIGDRICLVNGAEKETEHYYVEGVDINYSFDASGAKSNTLLTVTRGYVGDDEQILKTISTVSSKFKNLWSTIG